MADEYTPQQITVTIRTAGEWEGLNTRMADQWRDTPTQQLNSEVEDMLLKSAKTKRERTPRQSKAPKALKPAA